VTQNAGPPDSRGGASGQLHPPDLHEIGRQEDSQNAKPEGANHAVAQRTLLLLLRDAEHENGQHQGVISAEDTLQDDQEADRDQIGKLHIKHQATFSDAMVPNQP
jgi:hypothetical protein